MTRHLLPPMFMLVSLLGMGCGSKPSEPQTEISGTITLDGHPLPGAEVQFVPRGDVSLGIHNTTTDPQGGFVFKSDGAHAPFAPGEYVVLVRKIMTGANDPTKPGGGMSGVTNEVPTIYADRLKSPIRVEIKTGSQTLQPLDLKRARHS